MTNAKFADPSAARAAARASIACAVATIVSLGLGIAIVVTMGVTSGAGVAQASQEARQSALPLLILAEIMKLTTGAAVALAVRNCGRALGTTAAAAAVGYGAAALIFAAGLMGLAAVLSPAGAVLAGPVVITGLLSVPLTGCWAAMLAFGARFRLPLRLLAALLCFTGIVAFGLPPVAMLFGLLSIAWWLCLAILLRKTAA
jgi:hypothetical protein